MNNEHDSALATIVKTLALAAAWLGSMKLADVQTLVSIASGVAVLVVAILNARKLLRDERKKDESA